MGTELVDLNILAGLLALGSDPPLVTHDNSRVGTCKTNACNGDHRTLQYHENNLVISQVAIKAALQFCNTENGANKDSQRCDCKSYLCKLAIGFVRYEGSAVHTNKEPLPLRAAAQSNGAFVLVLRVAAHSECKFQRKSHEQGQREDLESQTSNHYVDTSIAETLSVGDRGQSTASCLQNQRKNIARDEDYCVCVWANSRDTLAVNFDDSCETDVNAGAEEGGTNSQGNKVPVFQLVSFQYHEKSAKVD